MELGQFFRNYLLLISVIAFSSCGNNSLEPITYCNNSKDSFWVTIDGHDVLFCRGNQYNDDSLVVDTLDVAGYYAQNDSLQLAISFCYKKPDSMNTEESFEELYNYFEKLYAPKTIHNFDQSILKNEGNLVVELWSSTTHFSTFYGPQNDGFFTPYSVITQNNGYLSPVVSFITLRGGLQCVVYSEDGSKQKEIGAFFDPTVTIF